MDLAYGGWVHSIKVMVVLPLFYIESWVLREKIPNETRNID